MYLSDSNENTWGIDIETDALDATVIHVMCCKNPFTGAERSFTDQKEMKSWIDEQLNKPNTRFIGHNFIGFDSLVLNKLLGTKITTKHIIDTMLLSMYYSPSLAGGHSLEAWGRRLGFEKLEFSDFSAFTGEMQEYCMRDTFLCVKVWQVLRKMMNKKGFTEQGCELEHKSWALIKRQERTGFHFNIEGAYELYSELRDYEHQLYLSLQEYWPPVLSEHTTYKKAKKVDGEYSSNFLKHKEVFEKIIEHKDGSYTVYDWKIFEPSSPSQRVDKLLESGWEPREFTPKTEKGGGGNPQPTRKGELSPSLVEFVEEGNAPGAKTLADWLTINSRANTVNTWIEAYNEETGCIHGNLWLANTLRYRHSEPNTANIPAVRFSNDTGEPLLGREGTFTYEARSLWTVRPRSNRTLVGVDAKGIQLRVLAHYLNNPTFTKEVVEGDPHSYNQEIGGFETRPIAKTFIYAFLLGAGDALVGEIIKSTQQDGKRTKNKFINNFPGLKDLLKDLQGQINKCGRITLCDGTPLIVTAPYTRLGYLLQGDESRIMKQAAIYVAIECAKQKLDVLKVGDIHDEWQSDVLTEHVDRYIAICVDAFKRAGETFNYRVPIECDAKKGQTWAETH